jgi:hypothetical protein
VQKISKHQTITLKLPPKTSKTPQKRQKNTPKTVKNHKKWPKNGTKPPWQHLYQCHCHPVCHSLAQERFGAVSAKMRRNDGLIPEKMAFFGGKWVRKSGKMTVLGCFYI